MSTNSQEDKKKKDDQKRVVQLSEVPGIHLHILIYSYTYSI